MKTQILGKYSSRKQETCYLLLFYINYTSKKKKVHTKIIMQFLKISMNNMTAVIRLVDGSWSCWSSWSKCSVTCGGGHYMRTRTCNNPPPAYGGDICLGLHTEEALCNTQPCPGTHLHTQTYLSDKRLWALTRPPIHHRFNAYFL